MKTITKSPDDTIKLGFNLGKKLKAGDVVTLIGELGSGKTTFTKGIAKALGVSEYNYVNSPSFVILKEYKPQGKQNKKNLYHFDLYRVKSRDDLETVGYEEYFYSKGVCVVEWADKIPEVIPEKHISVSFKYLNKNKREIIINENISD